MAFLFNVEKREYLLGAGKALFLRLFIRNDPKVLLFLPHPNDLPLDREIEDGISYIWGEGDEFWIETWDLVPKPKLHVF